MAPAPTRRASRRAWSQPPPRRTTMTQGVPSGRRSSRPQEGAVGPAKVVRSALTDAGPQTRDCMRGGCRRGRPAPTRTLPSPVAGVLWFLRAAVPHPVASSRGHPQLPRHWLSSAARPGQIQVSGDARTPTTCAGRPARPARPWTPRARAACAPQTSGRHGGPDGQSRSAPWPAHAGTCPTARQRQTP